MIFKKRQPTLRPEAVSKPEIRTEFISAIANAVTSAVQQQDYSTFEDNIGSHGKADFECLEPASQHSKIDYLKPDGKLTFDRLSSVYLSNTNHEESQPAHLKLLNDSLQKSSEHDVFDGPSVRYCPAGVYEWVEESGEEKFVINFQNCVHCKTCDIKDPNQNINWTCPQGGEGPVYSGM